MYIDIDSDHIHVSSINSHAIMFKYKDDLFKLDTVDFYLIVNTSRTTIFPDNDLICFEELCVERKGNFITLREEFKEKIWL